MAERRPGGQKVWLGQRIRKLADIADAWTPAQSFAYTHNGAFGQDVRFDGNGLVGSALVYEGVPVHVSLFRSQSRQL